MHRALPYRRRRPRLEFHYKIDHLLSLEERDTYIAFAELPTTTVDSAHAWLTERGYTLSRSAVARHRRRLLASRNERENSIDAARVLGEKMAAEGMPKFADATLLRIHHMLFDRLWKMNTDELSLQQLNEYVDTFCRASAAFRSQNAPQAEKETIVEPLPVMTAEERQEALEARILKILAL